jgi:hypothetical protein
MQYSQLERLRPEASHGALARPDKGPVVHAMRHRSWGARPPVCDAHPVASCNGPGDRARGFFARARDVALPAVHAPQAFGWKRT